MLHLILKTMLCLPSNITMQRQTGKSHLLNTKYYIWVKSCQQSWQDKLKLAFKTEMSLWNISQLSQNYNQDKPVYSPGFFSIDFWQDSHNWSQITWWISIVIQEHETIKTKTLRPHPYQTTGNDETSWDPGAQSSNLFKETYCTSLPNSINFPDSNSKLLGY